MADPQATVDGTRTPSVRVYARRYMPLIVHQLSVRRISAVYLWIGFIILFSLMVPGAFLSKTTLTVVFGEGVITCIVALAFLIPLTAGIYDLSVGAVMALSLVISIFLSSHTGLPAGLGAVIALLACAFSGFVSGFIVVRLRVNSFIATLGVSQVLVAVGLLISGNQQLIGQFSASWSSLGNGDLLGIPRVDFYLLAIALVLWYALEFTRVGRYLFATGGNAEAARLSGVRTDQLQWATLVASATLAGIAGIVYSMREGLYTSTVGTGYLFPAIAAVFLGASQLSHRPNVWGTLIAYFALAFGIQGIALSTSNAGVWSQPLFQGVALIVAVALAARPVMRKLKEQRADADAAPSPSNSPSDGVPVGDRGG